MSKYLVSIEPFNYHVSDSKLVLTAAQFKSAHFAPGKKFDIDRIEANVKVTLVGGPTGGGVTCAIEPSKKLVEFRTHRTLQILDLYLDPDPALAGRVHFLKAEAVDVVAHGDKCLKVEYPDTNVPGTFQSVPFGKRMQGEPQQARLMFGMKGKTPPFDYRIFILDKQGSVNGEDCDPQTSNDPPPP
jgi:hypothetical protein